MSKGKIFLIVILVIALIIAIVFIARASKPPTTVTVGSSTSTPGLGNSLIGIIAGAIGGGFANLFGGGKDKVDCVDGCNNNKKGYDCNGFPDVNCDFG